MQPPHKPPTTQDALRAIEALRSGVPSRHAVLAVGSNQPDIERSFRDALDQASDVAQSGTQPAGILISGDFGAGKSHVLDYLKQVALAKNFVCSKVVISKETALHKPDRLYAAVVENSAVPGAKAGPPIEALLDALERQVRSHAGSFDAFGTWVRSPESGLSAMFPATVELFERSASVDGSLLESIRGFWAGQQKIRVDEVRRGLQGINMGAAYAVRGVPAAELTRQRVTFMNHLIRGAGFSGWVLLLDEIELISSYGRFGRALSYGELAGWLGKLTDVQHPGMVCVATITSDFAEARILHPADGKPDREVVPILLEDKDPTKAAAARAQAGMNAIVEACDQRSATRLRGHDEKVLKVVYQKLKALHGQAYGWQPPDVAWPPEIATNAIRRYVRWWVISWDILRIYPTVTLDIVMSEIHKDYGEDPDIEAPSESEDNMSSGKRGA